MISLACAFEPSIRAAAALGPKARMPALKQASTRPATRGASGPTTTRSQRCSCASATRPATSVAATSKQSTLSRTSPAFPGAAMTSGDCGLRSNTRTSACSRPPEPTTRTLFKSERGDEVVYRDGGHRLVASGAAAAQLHRDPRHRLFVGRLDDVHEVEAPERGPLGLDGRPELLDLLVDLADARRVVLEGLNSLGVERREHHVGRHRVLPDRSAVNAVFYRRIVGLVG